MFLQIPTEAAAYFYSIFFFVLFLDLIFYVIDCVILHKVLRVLDVPQKWKIWIPIIRYDAISNILSFTGPRNISLFDIRVGGIAAKYWYIPVGIMGLLEGLLGFPLLTIIYYALLVGILGDIYARFFAIVEEKPYNKERLVSCMGCIVPIFVDIKFVKFLKKFKNGTEFRELLDNSKNKKYATEVVQ